MFEQSLNTAQIKGLSNVFFNLAVGLILGGLGLAFTGGLIGRIVVTILALSFALLAIWVALELLEGVKE